MPGVSQRGIRLPASPIRKLTPFADAAKSRGMKVYHLNIGQPDLPTPKKALDALKHVERTTLEYSPSNGLKSLREKLVGYYDRFGIKVTENEIIISSGGSEALLLTFLSCLDPGDEIILTEPSYANYQSFAVNAGVTVKTVTSDISNGFALPPVEYFEKAITDKTRAILICNPNNPTGYLYSEEELYRLRDIVRDHDLFLFSDEVYREFRYTDEPYLSALNLPGIKQNVVVIDSVSKRYSECGIRVGMIVSHNAEVMKTLMKMCQTRLSPPLLGQIVAEASIEGTEEYSRECFNEYLERRNFFIEGLNRIPGVFSPMPRGAFYTVASLPVDDTEDFCKWCLSEFSYKDEKTPEGFAGETVMMAPAAGFYRNRELGKNQVRMAYVLKKEDLARALTILEKALEAYNSKA
jgi:aspartate aminotransferase